MDIMSAVGKWLEEHQWRETNATFRNVITDKIYQVYQKDHYTAVLTENYVLFMESYTIRQSIPYTDPKLFQILEAC